MGLIMPYYIGNGKLIWQSIYDLQLEKPIDLRRQNEIRFGQPIHCMRPGRDLDLAPSEQDVGMMALFLGQVTDAIHESQGRFEIGEFASAHEVMFVDDPPLRRLGQLSMNLIEFVSL